ncbi:hypothetical protein SAMN05660816_05980 [Niastella yeongjuensis]|nr:hypothetical protein SAMN05660816_05980 [Niastella yeongjuensis]
MEFAADAVILRTSLIYLNFYERSSTRLSRILSFVIVYLLAQSLYRIFTGTFNQ